MQLSPDDGFVEAEPKAAWAGVGEVGEAERDGCRFRRLDAMQAVFCLLFSFCLISL